MSGSRADPVDGARSAAAAGGVGVVDAAASGAHDALVILATTASSASETLALQAPDGPTNCPTATVVLRAEFV